MKILQTVTLEGVKASSSKKVFISTRSVWWTDDIKDLSKDPHPCDPFGHVVTETDKDLFILSAEKSPGMYGQNGLQTFMAAHSKNHIRDGGESRAMYSVWTFVDRAVTRQLVEGWHHAKSGDPILNQPLFFIDAIHGEKKGAHFTPHNRAPHPEWLGEDGQVYSDVIYWKYV